MHMRVIRAQTRPGQVVELAKRWEAFYRPRLQGIPGFRHVHFGGDQETNTIIAVSVWDQLPDSAVVDQAMQAFNEQVRDIAAQQPTVEDFEILVEI